MVITYPRHGSRVREVELTDDTLIERTTDGTFVLPLAQVQTIRFYVGTKRNHDWHDRIAFTGPGLRHVEVSSSQADPAGIRESRAKYRKFVRLALERIDQAGASPQIPWGGYPAWLGMLLLGLCAVMLLFPLAAAGSGDPTLFVCFLPAAFVGLMGWIVWKNPQRMLTIAEARDLAVPEKGAD